MRRELMTGIAAGAVGTAALNIVTYVDLAVRGRPASQVPQEVAEKLADQAGIDLAPDGDKETAENRRIGLGSSLGYVTGLGVGAAYGLLRTRREVPRSLATIGVGLAAMAGSDLPSVALRVTDPSEWTAKAWMADIVPHLVYGVVTVVAYEAFARP